MQFESSQIDPNDCKFGLSGKVEPTSSGASFALSTQV